MKNTQITSFLHIGRLVGGESDADFLKTNGFTHVLAVCPSILVKDIRRELAIRQIKFKHIYFEPKVDLPINAEILTSTVLWALAAVLQGKLYICCPDGESASPSLAYALWRILGEAEIELYRNIIGKRGVSRKEMPYRLGSIDEWLKWRDLV